MACGPDLALSMTVSGSQTLGAVRLHPAFILDRRRWTAPVETCLKLTFINAISN